MTSSNNIVAWWNSIADLEENDVDDELINRMLRWKEIRHNLDGVKTILDIGGATGAFSIPLAREGFDVTHVDISPNMLDAAREHAKGLTNIHFIEADASDLFMFKDRQFDLVLNMDGAISFSGHQAGKVISESCRVSNGKLLITVSNKSCMIATWMNYSLKSFNKMSPAVYEMFENGYWSKEQFEENADMLCTIPMFKAYTTDELEHELTVNGMSVKFSRSIGTLSHLFLMHLRNSESKINQLRGEILNEFIKLCDRYDKEVMPNGPGSFRRSGIIALAEIKKAKGCL